MATLINGNGNPRIYAAQDADLIAALAGDITGIAQIGNKFAATAVDANTISVADGVIVTKEGRRIQLDAGSTDMFVIPTGTTGVTNYYIIGYKLTTQSDDSQIAETFVQLMSSSSETITEDTFREGATDVYVSLYRVQQNGVNLGTITGLLPELTNISELKSDLADVGNYLSDEESASANITNNWAQGIGLNNLDPSKTYVVKMFARVADGSGKINFIGSSSSEGAFIDVPNADRAMYVSIIHNVTSIRTTFYVSNTAKINSKIYAVEI